MSPSKTGNTKFCGSRFRKSSIKKAAALKCSSFSYCQNLSSELHSHVLFTWYYQLMLEIETHLVSTTVLRPLENSFGGLTARS